MDLDGRVHLEKDSVYQFKAFIIRQSQIIFNGIFPLHLIPVGVVDLPVIGSVLICAGIGLEGS